MNTPLPERRNDPVPEMMTEYGVWAFESHHAAKFAMPPTSHSFPKLLYIQDGSGEVHLAADQKKSATPVACKMGDCIFIPPSCLHWIVDQPTSPLSLFGLGVDLSRLIPTSQLQQVGPAGKLTPERVMLLGMRHRMRKLLYLVTQRNASSMLLASAIAIDTFAQLALASHSHLEKAKKPNVERREIALEEFLGWLESNFYSAISIDEAAHACQMSRRTFTTRFRERTGQTWLNYLNGMRIAYACRLLEAGDANITSVAFQSGFDDLSTFYRAMRRMTGKKPAEFRQA